MFPAHHSSPFPNGISKVTALKTPASHYRVVGGKRRLFIWLDSVQPIAASKHDVSLFSAWIFCFEPRLPPPTSQGRNWGVAHLPNGTFLLARVIFWSDVSLFVTHSCITRHWAWNGQLRIMRKAANTPQQVDNWFVKGYRYSKSIASKLRWLYCSTYRRNSRCNVLLSSFGGK